MPVSLWWDDLYVCLSLWRDPDSGCHLQKAAPAAVGLVRLEHVERRLSRRRQRINTIATAAAVIAGGGGPDAKANAHEPNHSLPQL